MHLNKLLVVLMLVAWNLAAWASTCEVSSSFSPFYNIEEVIHQELTKAKKSVHCSLYGISNPRLVQDLIDREKAGVEVIVTEDKKQSALASDLHSDLQKKGIRVVIKKTAVLEHNKFCVIDSKDVVMGSWNWSRSAQKQDNSEEVIKHCPDEAERFEQTFHRIMERDSK
jgi:phosphatidylserine/phosphatidylglycerophosphate/cardiolipin synthase-like enzyme